MIELRLRMMRIPARVAPFSDVPALQLSTSRKNDVCELGFPFKPDRLVYDELQLVGSIHIGETPRVCYGAERRTAVAVQHMHFRVARCRILKAAKLAFDGNGIRRIAFATSLEYRLGQSLAGDHLLNRVHTEQMGHPYVIVYPRSSAM